MGASAEPEGISWQHGFLRNVNENSRDECNSSAPQKGYRRFLGSKGSGIMWPGIRNHVGVDANSKLVIGHAILSCSGGTMITTLLGLSSVL